NNQSKIQGPQPVSAFAVRSHGRIVMNSAEDIPSEILNALLSSMFEISPIAMSISSSNGRDSRYLRVNDAYLKLIGRDWSELQGVRVAETAVKEDEARARRHKRLATEGGY